ncbi:MAG: AAA family ATPase [Clostridia bacterium]|nr:AAA family ATPase [Clostridia bacterium]
MSKVYVKITFKPEWLKGHADDFVHPSVVIGDFVTKKFEAAVSVKSENASEIVLAVDTARVNANEVVAFVASVIEKRYGEDPRTAITATLDEESANEDSGKIGGIDVSAKKKKIRLSSGSSGDEEDPFAKLRLFGREDAAPTAGESRNKELDEILNDIRSTPGNIEFLPLAEEIARTAPLALKSNKKDVFLYQSYLFSINDGYGIERYVAQLAKLLSVTGLMRFSGSDGLGYFNITDGESMNNCLSRISESRGGSPLLALIDVSEKMTDLNTAEMKNFVRYLATLKTSNVVYVFRVPYVDKDVLSRVLLNLNDLLYVRPVNFPPLGLSELREVARKELASYDLAMDDDAWTLFATRIGEEKRDGKFYGLDTVHKVVYEIIYKKLVADSARDGSSTTVTKDDLVGFVSDVIEDDKTGLEMLEAMVGTDAIKERILEIISQIELSRLNKALGTPSLHMRFVGNPGTGKTTVARIIGKILKEKGVLRVGGFFEYSGRDFVGKYIGETAPKVTNMCRDAYGSVLFIDEAYSLCTDLSPDSKDYGKEALATLIAEMENHRDDFVVIMAGYTDDIERMMKGNAGLASRVPYTIDFPNFTREQLYQIFLNMLGDKLEYEEEMLEQVRAYFNGLTDEFINAKEFSNARFVRNLFERTYGKAALRCQLSGETKICLTAEDFGRATSDREFANLKSLNTKKTARIGFGVSEN